MKPTRLLRRLAGERGSALIETALTLPLLLLISIGIFEFGRAFQTWQVLTNAVREGARVAVLPGTPPDNVQARVRTYMQAGQLPEADSASVDVTTSTIAMGSENTNASTVTVVYPFNFVVLNPVARLVVGNSNLGAAPISMTVSSVMRNESQF